MNIFFLHEYPDIAANYHCNEHVRKMITEYAQMLSTAHRVIDGVEGVRISKNGRKIKHWTHPHRENELYLATHVNHPSNIWVRTTYYNYMWMYACYHTLLRMFEKSTGKQHESAKLKDILLYPPVKIKSANLTVPPRCIKDEYLLQQSEPDTFADVITNYRHFYNKSKSRFATFGKYNNPVPHWYTGE